ncbi:MAG: phosphodiesterase [Thermoplasmata archaeon]|nr:MAG: phosphodiesterase [Thermoplasmata archaeon]
MRILAAADIHGSQYRLNLILDNIERYNPDIAVIAGDITQFGPGDVARNFLDQIPVYTLTLPGNIDTSDVLKGIEESKAENIHLRRIEYQNVTFVGINGVRESETIDFIEKNKDKLSNIDVLVTHIPPYGLQDRVFLGLHSGDKTLRELVDTWKPRLVISGHIHENPGYTKTPNGSIIVNCSIGKKGSGALIKYGKEITVEMLE